MRRRKVIKLAASSAVATILLDTTSRHQVTNLSTNQTVRFNAHLAAAADAIAATIAVDWSKKLAEATTFTFGSNDYEITLVKNATDAVFQRRLSQLNIQLIRIHHFDLCERWSNQATKTWDEAKIKTCFDASYPQNPTIIQNIPHPPSWMKKNEQGLLDPSEHENYAAFCAKLVEILNLRQQRQIRYWEPINEQDVPYQKAGKLDQLWKLYNQVATAMKAQDSTIKVGGPVLTWDNPRILVPFLEACKANVDFISWHRYGSGDANAPTEKIMSYTPKYGQQVRQFREIARKYVPERNLPLLLGEYNINYSWKSGENRQNTHVGAVWFASVLKHLAEAGIEMATSWHLKDGIYGMIDPENNFRPAANVFAWANKYLVGEVMSADSDHTFVEAMAVVQSDETRSLLLLNKSDRVARLKIQGKPNNFHSPSLAIFSLDADGTKTSTLATTILEQEPLILKPYSLVLLRFPTS
ncbi:MAG: hypothetical protein SAJ37_02950 [Oscillatoria sp. PMC 1068.18]|nr:hypothetical protein [Oscillatoria sp. PMC 1076.18]MEC4987682.1 hypothetical protein [Oscillatoria sp. PMC 1068.18]